MHTVWFNSLSVAWTWKRISKRGTRTKQNELYWIIHFLNPLGHDISSFLWWFISNGLSLEACEMNDNGNGGFTNVWPFNDCHCMLHTGPLVNAQMFETLILIWGLKTSFGLVVLFCVHPLDQRIANLVADTSMESICWVHELTFSQKIVGQHTYPMRCMHSLCPTVGSGNKCDVGWVWMEWIVNDHSHVTSC